MRAYDHPLRSWKTKSCRSYGTPDPARWKLSIKWSRASETSRKPAFAPSCGAWSKKVIYATRKRVGHMCTARSSLRGVRQIIDSFCQGSVVELVSGMVDAKVLSKGELETLEEFVRSRKGGK